jgi:hypothetical protein
MSAIKETGRNPGSTNGLLPSMSVYFESSLLQQQPLATFSSAGIKTVDFFLFTSSSNDGRRQEKSSRGQGRTKSSAVRTAPTDSQQQQQQQSWPRRRNITPPVLQSAAGAAANHLRNGNEDVGEATTLITRCPSINVSALL